MSARVESGNGIQTKLLWAGVAALGAVSFGIVALSRGETVNVPISRAIGIVANTVKVPHGLPITTP